MTHLLQGSRRLAWAIGMAVIIALGVILGLVVLGIAMDTGRPIRWEIPAGYRGWVVVLYENPACPALRAEGFYAQVVPIDANGCGCTSSSSPTGWRSHRYEYVEPDDRRVQIRQSGWGGNGEIWAGYTATRQPSSPFPLWGYFVGSEAELKTWGWTVGPGGPLSRQKELACEQAASPSSSQ